MNWFEKIRKRMTEPLPMGGVSLDTIGNFTPRAQQVLALARKEADRFHHNFVGTEHLLLGLIKLGQGVAVNVLQKMGLDLGNVRMEVEELVGTGPDQKLMGNIPYTPRVKKVLALAAQEAKYLNHTYVGTEHILLGLLREGDGVAARVLKDLRVDIEQTRQEVLRELDPNFVPGEVAGPISTPRRAESTPMRVEIPKDSASPKPGSDLLDVAGRYDVYCNERGSRMVVYRNALFKSVKRIFRDHQNDTSEGFVELEQADGQTIFVSRCSIIKFCAHGTTPGAETVSNPET